MDTVVPGAEGWRPGPADWASPHPDDGARAWEEPEALAEELLAAGIGMMKIQMGPKIAQFKNTGAMPGYAAPGPAPGGSRRLQSAALPEGALDALCEPVQPAGCAACITRTSHSDTP